MVRHWTIFGLNPDLTLSPDCGDAEIWSALDTPGRLFLEIGGSRLSVRLREHPQWTQQHIAVTVTDPLAALGELWLAGLPINWAAARTEPVRRVPLPGYPFQRQRYLVEVESGPAAPLPSSAPEAGLDTEQTVSTLFTEVLGLTVLMRLHLARSRARFDRNGQIVLLPDQDRALWDASAIAQAVEVLDRAAALSSPGPYQLQASIAAVHSQARSWQETDWARIVALYDTLLRVTDTPVIRLNRAVALARMSGPQVALGEVNDLAITLGGYHLFHATRAELLDELGERSAARKARLRALELTENPAERLLLMRKLEVHPLVEDEPEIR